MILIALAVITATPATLPAALVAAVPGDVVRLAKGDYSTATIKDVSFDPPITVLAADATVRGISIVNAGGVTWVGGNITQPTAKGFAAGGYAVHINGSRQITIRNAVVRDAVRGFVVSSSSDVELIGNRITGFTIDGFNVAGNSERVTGRDNYADSGATGEAHPDLWQSWTRAGQVMSDIVVTRNVFVGRAQGVYFGNLPDRKPAGDPGFDRVSVSDNWILMSNPTGIGLADCRECVVTGNFVASLPGSRFRANAWALRSTGLFCGNGMPALPTSSSAKPC